MPATKKDPVDEVRDDLAVAEQVLQSLWEDDREPTYEETILFRRCGWDDLEIKRQRRRFHTIARLKSICGTKADRAAMQKETETAAKVYAEKSPDIQAEIDRLQQRLRSLENDRDRSAKRLSEMNEAAEQLSHRDLLPAAVRGEYLDQYRQIAAGVKGDVLALEGELRHVHAIATYDSHDPKCFDSIKHCGHQFIEPNGSFYRVRHDLWQQFVNEQQARIPQIEQELAEARAEYDRELATLDELRQYYLD